MAEEDLPNPSGLLIYFLVISIIYLTTVLQTGYIITKFEKTGYKDLKLLQNALNPGSMKKKYDNYTNFFTGVFLKRGKLFHMIPKTF